MRTMGAPEVAVGVFLIKHIMFIRFMVRASAAEGGPGRIDRARPRRAPTAGGRPRGRRRALR